MDMYITFAELIKYANQEKSIKFIIVSGAGKNYTSGNDLSNFSRPEFAELNKDGELAGTMAHNLRVFCDTII